MKSTPLPIVKLPEDMQFSLYLIKEELKCRKMFRALHKIGLDDCYFQPHLDSAILISMGLNDGTDETFNFYNAIIERRSRKIKADPESITRQALKCYNEIMSEIKNK